MSEGNSGAFHPLRMGLDPQPMADWLKPQASDEALCALRKELTRTKADLVLAVRAEAHAAVAELADILRERGFTAVKPGNNTATLTSMAESIAEDMCILTPTPSSWGLSPGSIEHPRTEPTGPGNKSQDDAEKTYLFTAGVLCFPNRWKLPDKIGKTLIETHAPVPEYAATVGTTVDRFLARLRPLRFYTRRNWGLASVPDLHLPESVAPVNPTTDTNFYLRMETQGFLKLPQTEAVVFSIRTNVTPWAEVPAEMRAAILDAVRELSAPWKAYKSIRE